MCDSSESQSKSKSIAFSINKKLKTTNISINNKLNTDLKPNESNEIKDFVTSIDDKEIRSTVKKEAKKELVIPLILNNRYTKGKAEKDRKTEAIEDNNEIQQKEDKSGETLEEMAKRELLREAMDCLDETNGKEMKSSKVIPIMDSLITNRVPKGFESEDNFDVSLRPIEPTLEDYEAVPIEEFGYGLLRGMGWTPGMPIGANTKETYIPVEPKIRAKGLGLGADTSLHKQIAKKSEDLKEEELQLKKGSFVYIECGAHKGSYGVIEDFDDDMSRVTIKLTLNKESIKTPMALVRVVSKKEFQSESKVINKTEFDKYKQNEEKPKKHNESERKNRKEVQKSVKKEEKRSDNRSESMNEDKRKDNSQNTWILPNLKVRIIDKNYKNGKYYKEKVVIIDVLTQDKCCCKTSNERILEDIGCRMLETVIPRHNDINVLILEGKYRKELGLIVERNENRKEAKVQLLSDKRKIVCLSFDQICEYVNEF